jgi:LysW-gamma-L-lysine carboxypeptidase
MKPDPVDLLQELVDIKSLSGQEGAASTFLAAQMAALGMTARVDEVGNAVGLRENPDAAGGITREIVLLGHIDTVPGDIPVRVEDGQLYGRGSVDAKGPLAAFVMAAARAELAPGTRLVVIGAVEEEAATSRGARHAATQYRPAFCIIGEPSGWDGVTLGYKGRLRLRYTLARPMAHSAGAASSPAEEAVAWWNALTGYVAAFNAGRERMFDQLLPSLSDLHTGSDGLINTVMASAGLRLPPGVDPAALEADIRRLAGDASLQATAYEPAFQTDRGTPLARAFNRALREMGQPPRFKLKTGTSDMNVVGPAWGCPIVAYGPGESALDHTPDEHVAVEDYLRAIDVLVRVCAIIQGQDATAVSDLAAARGQL